MEKSLSQFENMVRELRVETLTHEALRDFAYESKDYIDYVSDLIRGKNLKITELTHAKSSAEELCKSILAIIDIINIFDKEKYKNLSYEGLLKTNMNAIKSYVDLWLMLYK